MSKNIQKKVPEIRFSGFDDDWEQRKLGQVANYRRGSFPQPYGNKEWYDGENSMPFVQVVDVGDNLRLVEDTKQKISELAQPKSVFVEEGKVVVTLQGSIGRVAITQYPAYVDRTLLIFESYKAEMDEYYFAYVIQQLFEYEKTRAPGGTIKTITKEALSNFTISFPSIAEQKKLGKFFEQLDDTIALHQRKIEALKQMKKGFLQQLFPEKGENIPKVRFTDFKEEWEQRKLGDVADIVGGGTPSTANPEYWDGNIDWYAPAEIGEQIYVSKSQRTITELGQQKSSAKILPVGTVLFTSRAGIGNTAILAKEATTNQGFQSIVPHKDELDSYFIFSRTNELKRYGEVTGAGSTFVEVSGKQMAKMPLLIPSIAEQRQIGSFFKQLDNTITLHQRKLDQLNKLKTAFLQKMFI